MARDNARLTHAMYDKNTFNSENTGPHALPNAADSRFIEAVKSLPGFRAQFYSLEGDVMVSCDRVRIDQNLPEALTLVAERFGMVRTDNYDSPNVVTFEYEG